MQGLSHIDDWIFDLDNTLYRGDVNFFGQIDRKMTEFMANFLGLPAAQARKTQKDFLVDYGTTLNGLMQVHNMDPDAFLEYVHDIDLSLLVPDSRLPAALSTLPGRKYIFTNGSRAHAKNVGEHLGIYDLFDGVFAIEDTNYSPKPKASAYDAFIAAFDINPSQAFMAEDMARNLEIPKALGMHTLLVTSNADWTHEPKAARPAAQGGCTAIDSQTDDLPGWLERLIF